MSKIAVLVVLVAVIYCVNGIALPDNNGFQFPAMPEMPKMPDMPKMPEMPKMDKIPPALTEDEIKNMNTPPADSTNGQSSNTYVETKMVDGKLVKNIVRGRIVTNENGKVHVTEFGN